jgi:hypothetical protein
MPRATSNSTETERLDLKSIEGGFVVAKRLTYGEKLQRRAMVSGMKLTGDRKSKDFQGEMNLVNEQATLFDFQRCIVQHNLTKPSPSDPENEEADVPMDLSNFNDIKLLDPRAGEEIDTFLSELNNFEEDDEGN